LTCPSSSSSRRWSATNSTRPVVSSRSTSSPSSARSTKSFASKAGIRVAQVARGGRLEKDGIVVLDDSTNPEKLHLKGAYKLSDELRHALTVPQFRAYARKSHSASDEDRPQEDRNEAHEMARMFAALEHEGIKPWEISFGYHDCPESVLGICYHQTIAKEWCDVS